MAYLLLRLVTVSLLALALGYNSKAASVQETRYLAFQIFIGSPDPAIPIGDSDIHPLGPMPSRASLRAYIEDIKTRIGTTGNRQRKLAVIFGPLAFDQSDAQVAQFIDTAFSLGKEENVAVGFHVDDSLFWAGRKDLLKDPRNVEWTDWNGPATTGRRIDWGPEPKRLAPQMCFNSRPIMAEVHRRAQSVMGKEIRLNLDRLQKQGKADLFAGVIVGWETMIGQDFATGRSLGYHALTNLGLGKTDPPEEADKEREQVVQSFITLWCTGFADAGVPTNRIYSHVAFLPHKAYEGSTSYLSQNHFATADTAFGPYRRPGFSTYPLPGLNQEIRSLVAQKHPTGWASSEGTNLQLGSRPGQSGVTMEGYLAQMFNHGATLVNLFSWGIGGEANKKMDFRVVTEGPEAVAAYRKFLGGGMLIEPTTTAPTLMERLPAKIHLIQSELPTWIQRTHDEASLQPLMQKLDTALKANDLTAAEKIADEILRLISSK